MSTTDSTDRERTPKTIIFLGPSLSWEEARQLLPDATFLPPAQAGDVFKAVQQGADVIAIVDGLFEQVPSVWHKEVLYALSRGVHVYGASSMGALRASELHQFGMVGVGRIFEAYRDGLCEDDDEVTVGHGAAAEGWKALSEAMVNVRHGLAEARQRGLIGERTHDRLVAGIKARHYAERSWALVPELAAAAGLPAGEVDALLSYVRREKPNLKREDSLELLARLQELQTSPPPPVEVDFDFEPTVFWEQLAGTVRTARKTSQGDVSIAAMRAHVAVAEEGAHATFEGALLLYLVAKEARRVGLQAKPEEVNRVAERFRRRHGLQSAAATHAWLAQNGCGREEFSALMEMLALVEAMLEHHGNGVDAFLPAELQRQGRYGAVAAAVQEKARLLGDLGLAFPSPEDAGTTAGDLVAFYERRFRPLDAPFEEHHKSRGLEDRHRFLREVLAEYLRERRSDAAARAEKPAAGLAAGGLHA